MKVYIPRPIAKEGTDYLISHGYKIKYGSAQDEATMTREISDCDAVIIRLDPLTRAMIDAAPNLKVIARHGVGLDNIDVDYATEKGIWVTNGPLSNTGAVAEHTIMFLLLLARKVRSFNESDPASAFNDYQLNLGTEISGKTLGIIGYGRIGQQVARIASAGFGMPVIAWSRNLTDKPVIEKVHYASTPEEVYEQADFVSLHLSLNPRTKGFINTEALSRMKHNAFLINSAREELVDREALLTALTKDQIAGAAIDFAADEASLHYLQSLIATGKVIITPHSGSMTVDAMRKMALHAAQGVHEVLSRQVPTWSVNTPVR